MSDTKNSQGIDGVAIIGMAGRFPKAGNIDEFWQNLKNGVEAISFFTDDELLQAGVDPAVLKKSNYVKAKGVLEGIKLFDASFFGYNPREAEIIDPQQRVFLECAWEALENAGYNSETYQGAIGVFAGASMNTYLPNNLHSNPELMEVVGDYQAMIGNDKDFLATRVAYELNLKGPSVTVQSACSTSLVAVSMACQSLLSYQSDMILAGGVSIMLPQKAGYFYNEGGIVSPDGHCRTFDHKAQGMLTGEGVAIVVLKRLEDALADGDNIYAVIKGFAVNNDGSAKVGYTAPSVDGQADAIATAQALSGFDPETITYIEAHGTATPLGDPIEIAGLTKAFRTGTDAKGFCAIGSVKTNIGHLDITAGVAGLIKTVLALRHKQLPPSLNFEKPNPKIDFENSPFYVNSKLSEWKTNGAPRRAGVSSMGIGGTNAHVVLEEAPLIESSEPQRPWYLLPLSAKTPSALEMTTANLLEHFRKNPDLNLADVAYTLQVGRRPFAHRRILVCSDLADAMKIMEIPDPNRVFTEKQEFSDPSMVFMFPGQGSQYVNMGLELYKTEPIFRETIDQCAEFLKPRLGLDLREILYPTTEKAELAAEKINQTAITQPALFSIEFAMAKLWMSWGVQPQVMIGHSVGEFVAACLAGVFSLEDALGLVATRGRLIQSLPPGNMLAVRLPESEIQPFLNDKLSIAAINGPSLCVVSGPAEAVSELEKRLAEKEIVSRHLHTSHAFHSAMMEPILEPFSKEVKKIKLSPPHKPFVSSVTGNWITDAEATDANYWVQHCRRPVRFAPGLQTILQTTQRLLLEVGPGMTLSTFAKQIGSQAKNFVSFSSLRHPQDNQSDVAFLIKTLGRLWLAGTNIDWAGFYSQEQRRRVPLPSYPFERKEYWVEPTKRSIETSSKLNMQSNLIPSNELTDNGNGTKMEVVQTKQNSAATTSPQDRLRAAVLGVVSSVSGLDKSAIDTSISFLELGLDSLMLIQLSRLIQSKFNIQIPFRQILEELPTIDAVTLHLEQNLPPEALPPEEKPAGAPAGIAPAPDFLQSPSPTSSIDGSRAFAQAGAPALSNIGSLEQLLLQQLQITQQMVEVIVRGNKTAAPQSAPPALSTLSTLKQDQPAISMSVSPVTNVGHHDDDTVEKFGPFKPAKGKSTEALSDQQKQRLDEFIARFNARTQKSKQLAQKYRQVLADVRVSTGFRKQWKELVYPITMSRASGARAWDLDGNEYVDLNMGFGVNLFGHSPDFVTQALREQIEQEPQMVGPQTPLAGQVAELFSELTGMQRVTFCNTGSEAVMAAIRLARTATGRTKIVMFTNDYHGNFETVLVRKQFMPITLGMPKHEDVVVLDYNRPETLEYLRAHGHEFAAALVEPVQSRHPYVRPKEFLLELREVTKKTGTALIFDEVITGFRVHRGGAQAYFGVQADLATYGKIVCNGMPIGVVAGKPEYMDAVDGGTWNYGDASSPQADQTFFAGTFCKHPYALATAWAVLNHMKEKGPALQNELNERTEQFADTLNVFFEQNQLPLHISQFSSFFVFRYPPHLKFIDLFFYYLIDKGVSVWGDRTYFLSTAHKTEDIDFIIRAVQESAMEMKNAGFFPEPQPVEPSGGKQSSARSEGLSKGTSPQITPESAEIVAKTTSVNGTFDVPLTEAQKEVWVEAQMGDDASCAYNMSYILRLQGALDVSALRHAVQTVIDRHDALRTTFSADGDFQRVTSALKIEVPFVDYSSMGADDRQKRVQELLKQEDAQLFDLVNDPLIRAQIVKLQEREHLFVITAHHIVCDGFSSGILLDELSAIYSSQVNRTSISLRRPKQFSEYAKWQEKQQQSPEMKAAEEYWLKQFDGPIPVLELPTDRPRPPLKTHKGGREIFAFDSTLYKALQRAGAKQGATLFNVLLTGFNILLHRLTGQDDLVVGILVAGQTIFESEDLIGHCANALPIRNRINGASTFSECLASVKKTVFRAFDHQNYTFGSLIQKLNIARDFSRVPLVSILFNVDRTIAKEELWKGLQVEFIQQPRGFVNFDAFVDIIDNGRDLLIKFDYNTDLFDGETIRRWMRHFETMLKAIAADPSKHIADLPLLSEAERRQVLVEWNDTKAEYSRTSCLHELFEKRAEQTPDAVAVVCGDESMTYKDLNRRANQLARHLQGLGVGPETLVGICVERSLAMMVGLLGILKAGGAYVPLDPAYPKERLALMLEDSQATVLLTQENLVPDLPEHHARLVVLDKEWGEIAKQSADKMASGAGPDNRAYVIYTSGSTGKPKGVQICHRAVVNFMESVAKKPGLTPNDVLLAVTTLSFDISILELFLPITVGARVVVASREVAADGNSLKQLLSKCGATVMQATPATWRMLIEAGWQGKKDLKTLCGGEALPRELADELLDLGASLWNMYGPTETTIWSAVGEIKTKGQRVSIGPPMANTEFYVLDAFGHPVPIGVPGELYIGGDGLARGYLHRPELTNEKFVPDPFSGRPAARLYRTGDLVRHQPDGQIEFLGRIDHQVKLRGFRIELGEIESVLNQYATIQTAVVIVREDAPGDKRLVAYVKYTTDDVPSNSELRKHLQEKLPDYMVPAFFVKMDEFPLTPSGKIDRKQLPAPDAGLRTIDEDFVAPSSPMEITVASIWQEILGVDQISTFDNFFEIGGHSLLSMRVINEIEKQTGKRISPREMVFQTLGEIAASCETNGGSKEKKPAKGLTKKLFSAIKEAVS